MRQTDITTKERPLDDEQLLRHAKWRSLLFDKAGKCYRGTVLKDTKDEANLYLLSILNEAAPLISDGKNPFSDSADGKFFWMDYAWHMQIPVMP